MLRTWESLYSKNGLAAKKIAKELIQIDEGQRIPRVEDFVNQLSMGRGTVQGAYKVLEEIDAIQLESRGHLGTFLRTKKVQLLKEVAGIGPLMGAMPLPYSLFYEGLATGLIEVSESLIYPINLAYMRGAKQRQEALISRRYDFVVMSQLAAELEMEHNRNLQIALNLGPRTYVTKHQIFMSDSSNDFIKSGMRIGVDHTSIDQSKLTLLECEGMDVELVAVTYMQLFEKLVNGDLDAAVWNSDDARTFKKLKRVDFRSEKAKAIAEKASTSVVLIEKDRTDVLDYLLELNKEKVIEIQQLVINHKKIPKY
ncbi:transcriptional regulator [Paraliobacillus quinghaiensis]|uniref:Transcriptional regulator n=1 Tax=Paraliobacillus quinghaiensis TaxID=470815 RepID=A0A917TUW5_9BACI|nr:GntR family transcriptional regulator YhfZ [Paraliobacillus quinghaiensis]GGM38567.1 transcriptional regulator [Paraliobacillus quinghaiensis]